MSSITSYLYIAAVGFVAAGILSSFVQLVSGKPARFNLAPDTFIASLGTVALGAVAGPAIVMRNAWLGMTMESRAPVWFALSLLIAGFWSLFSGCILLAVILGV